jgi:hypothetical protein
MPEPIAPVKEEDQYEIGNTDYVIDDGKTNPSNEGLDRPRNPDGTFAPIKPVTVVTAAAVATPSPPAPERAPQYLIEAARDFGLTDDEIDAMPVNVLHKTMFQAQRRMDMVRQQSTRQQTIQDGQVRNPEPVKDELDFEIDEENLHPTIAKGLSTLRTRAKAERDENRALRNEVQALRTRDEQRELNRAAAIYDAAFQGLGEEFEPIIGKGAGRDMDNKTPEYKRRIAILTEAGADPRTHTPAQVKAKVKAAADTLFPRTTKTAAADAYAEVTEPKKNGKAPRITTEEWNDAALVRPTGRKVDDEPPSEKKAVRNLAAKMREQDDVIADSEELEGFL